MPVPVPVPVQGLVAHLDTAALLSLAWHAVLHPSWSWPCSWPVLLVRGGNMPRTPPSSFFLSFSLSLSLFRPALAYTHACTFSSHLLPLSLSSPPPPQVCFTHMRARVPHMPCAFTAYTHQGLWRPCWHCRTLPACTPGTEVSHMRSLTSSCLHHLPLGGRGTRASRNSQWTRGLVVTHTRSKTVTSLA